ncbi:hypothetical protein OS493_002351 [Desmophyllum pertusum]|uniref:Uncharacterized protein n=1 Tax=Desmophyllum pertusum TaxID=174260 RepID=A0A9X0CPJ2_9CNID|nr:hypothetical protein OS493_002351 [Desmophyllum pertusum]
MVPASFDTTNRKHKDHETIGQSPVRTIGQSPVQTIGQSPVQTIGQSPVRSTIPRATDDKTFHTNSLFTETRATQEAISTTTASKSAHERRERTGQRASPISATKQIKQTNVEQ